MKAWLFEKKVRAVLAASMLGTGVIAGSLAGLTATTGASASTVTLTMESTPENTITDSFNPYSTTSSGEQMGSTSLIYETLYQFDLANPTISYPWLATGYKWGNNGKSITFTIRSGVTWTNGSPLTAADVAFSYGLVQKYADINTGGLAISSVTSSGSTVTINFPSAAYTELQQIGNVYIVPQSIWSSVGDPGQYVDATPVGTGPYIFQASQFTPQGFTLTANPHYWQPGKPAIPSVFFPAYASNTNALNALVTGQADWEGNFIPGLNKIFVDKSPATHAYWMAPGNTVTIEPNLKVWPTNVLGVRQAISDAINRTQIGAEGEDGLEAPATNASGDILPTFKSWLAPAVKSDTLSATPEVAAAKAALVAAGYHMGKDGYFQTSSGKTVAVTIKDPSSYTDFAADGSLIAGELRKVGIQATFDGQSVNAWNSDVADGNFSIIVHWSNGGISPYAMYNGWLNSALDTKAASGDYEQLHSAAMNAALTKLGSAVTLAQQVTDLTPIEEYVATSLPVIPVTYGASWDEYNSTNIVGWPTAKNPYESGQPGAPTNEVVVLHLSPR
jgi:peptide/nickel transport system substrate-binding protein